MRVWHRRDRPTPIPVRLTILPTPENTTLICKKKTTILVRLNWGPFVHCLHLDLAEGIEEGDPRVRGRK